MSKFYIYNANTKDKKFNKVTVVFNPQGNYDFNSLKTEFTSFFHESYQTNALVFVHANEILDFAQLMSDNKEILFKSLPQVEETSLASNIFHLSYHKSGYNIDKDSKENFIKKNIKEIINQGLVNIFIKNDGLVESTGVSHHYVFPSGKHSSKFLRTANVLVRKSEIDFVALNTLYLFKDTSFKNIYCDTLSITVVGYSMISFLKKFGVENEINIESFKSYEGIYDKNYEFYTNSIFLISATTSGGLVNYIKKSHPEIHSNEVATLYYLPSDDDSSISLERVVCNLAKNKKFNYGVDKYPTYKPGEKCEYCSNHSTPISIIGDSFSLDEPIINTRNVAVKDYITTILKDFVELFRYKPNIGSIFSVSYNEERALSNKKYNLYIDYEKIITNITQPYFSEYKARLDAYINQFIPASTKYIIYLNDNGSFELARYIHNSIEHNSTNKIEIINQSDLKEGQIDTNFSGSIIIVASCITNGKNLLYLSRFFRNFELMRLVYFVGINRVADDKKYKELQANLKYGRYGQDNSSFVEIEMIRCDNSNSRTSWQVEMEYLKDLQEESSKPLAFITKRIELLKSFSSSENKGGTKEIFYRDLNNKLLIIRKNSVFFNNNEYFNKINQADVYFTICCVLNNMRNNATDGLYQTNFVKNLIDPLIFNRFNDGIIQASILRGARAEELNYSFSFKISEDMVTLLKTFIKHINEYQGEAVLEFLFALSIGKLKLYKDHYIGIIDELKQLEDKIPDSKYKIIDTFRVSIEKVYYKIFNIDKQLNLMRL